MFGPLNIDLLEYGISEKNGFLPDINPLPRLHSHSEWEDLVDDIPQLLKNGTFRERADRLQILGTDNFTEENEWQKAYHLLSFMTHAYIWGGQQPSEVLPPQITKPFLKVSSHLNLPPTATYAALNLWNFTPKSPNLSLTDPSNLSTIHTFTSTLSESWFYLISISIEARGADLIPTMLSAINAIRISEPHVLLSCLNSFTTTVRACSDLLKRMYEHCEPEVFYHVIRPYLAGSKNMGIAGLPRGIFYDEGEGKGEWREFSGGSNAQSSLIQFWDAVLGVTHSATKGTGSATSGEKENAFLQDMRNYMPGPHRRFLESISAISPTQSYISNSACDPKVTRAYNEAVETLAAFRDIHIEIVTRYIVNPSRKAGNRGYEMAREEANTGMNLAIATTGNNAKDMRGTGGTQLIPFLRQSRDETRGMAVPVLTPAEGADSVDSTDSEVSWEIS